MADFGIPSVSELLPSDLVKQMRDQGGKKFLSKADELTKNALPAAAVLAGRQVPGADATARRVAALLVWGRVFTGAAWARERWSYLYRRRLQRIC